ncbi:MAG: hypothetical protein N3C58_02245 [Meiothermus ruber]|nr:hypothetical protein [Meiothermus ruber]
MNDTAEMRIMAPNSVWPAVGTDRLDETRIEQHIAELGQTTSSKGNVLGFKKLVYWNELLLESGMKPSEPSQQVRIMGFFWQRTRYCKLLPKNLLIE